jgi:hypothetical protein
MAALAFALVFASSGARAAPRARSAPAGAPAPPARSWSETFAAESDTVLFMSEDGGLWRAPFHLGSRDVVWSPPGHDHLVRLAVSPDGRHVGWLARDFDQDTTTLWVADLGENGAPAQPCARFESFRPTRYGSHFFEPHVPTLKDRDVRGARLLAPSVSNLRTSSNALAWTAAGEALVYGDADGVVEATPDCEGLLRLSQALLIDLIPLGSVPMQLANAVMPVEHRPEQDWLVAYTAGGRWRMFGALGLNGSRHWSAGLTRVWWPEGRSVHSIRVNDPIERTEIESPVPVVWVRAESHRDVLWWAAGNQVRRREGETEKVMREFSSPILAVLEAPGGRGLAAITRDSLLWLAAPDPATPDAQLAGFQPDRLLVGAQGEVVVARPGGRHRVMLARLDRARGTLVPFEAPVSGDVQIASTPRGTYLVLYAAGARAPRRLTAYDFATQSWSELENPGVIGWEPLSPR